MGRVCGNFQLLFVDLGMILTQMLCTAALDPAVSGFMLFVFI